MAGFTTFSLKEEEKVSVLKLHFIFLYFVFQMNEDVLFVSPQDQSVRLCPALPAGPPVPETKDGLSVNDSVGLWGNSSGGLFTVGAPYLWAWSTHGTRSTRCTLPKTNTSKTVKILILIIIIMILSC